MQCLTADEEPFVVPTEMAAHQPALDQHITFEERVVLKKGIASYPDVAHQVEVTRLSQKSEGVAVSIVVFVPVVAYGIPAIEDVAYAEAVARTASVGKSFPHFSQGREMAEMADM